jgi:2-succinyl-6-hydroxy-2,4-cyclohexadiene-1-carboxylate synthase
VSPGPTTLRIRRPGGLELRVHRFGSLDGSPPPVLLLHGFTGSVEAWGRLPETLAGVRPVLAVDLPGHGKSGIPDRPARVRLEEVVRDLVAVLNRVGAPRAAWVGYSMGGRVALGGAVQAPERVERLVLESASPGLETAEARARRRAADEDRARELDATVGEPGALVEWVDRWMGLPLFESQRRLPDEVLERERSRRLRGSPRGWSRVLRGMGTGSQPSFWRDLSRVRVPTLVLTGRLDPKFDHLGDRMARALPRGRRVRVDGAGHAVHLEAPEPWLREVGAFLNGPD